MQYSERFVPSIYEEDFKANGMQAKLKSVKTAQGSRKKLQAALIVMMLRLSSGVGN